VGVEATIWMKRRILSAMEMGESWIVCHTGAPSSPQDGHAEKYIYGGSLGHFLYCHLIIPFHFSQVAVHQPLPGAFSISCIKRV